MRIEHISYREFNGFKTFIANNLANPAKKIEVRTQKLFDRLASSGAKSQLIVFEPLKPYWLTAYYAD